MAVAVVHELVREQVPRRFGEHFLGKLTDGVVLQLELLQHVDACLGHVQLVVIGLRQQLVKHVLQHVLALQVVVLDVLALATLETLLERNHQEAAVQGLGLVAELRKLVDALDHEAVEQHRARVLELAVHQERVVRDD